MRNDRVECKKCSKVMIPKVIMERPVYVNGVPFGGDVPLKSICPFCLTDRWGDVPPPSFFKRLRRDAWVALRATALEWSLLIGIPLVLGLGYLYRIYAG